MLSYEEDEVRRHRDVVAQTPSGHPERPLRLARLSAALAESYEVHGRQGELLDAIRLAREALGLVGQGHPVHGAALAILGSALKLHYEITDEPADLDEAIEALAQAVDAMPERHGSLFQLNDDLAMLLSARFQSAKNPADLDRAIEAEMAAAHLAEPDNPDRSAYGSNVGNWLTQRFDMKRRPDDAQQAVVWMEWALAAAPVDDPDRPHRLGILGAALCARSASTGALADLDRAISVTGEGLDALAAGDPQQAKYLSDLDLAHLARFKRAGFLADLNEALRFAQAAVRAAAAGSHDEAMYRCNLANRLMDRFGATSEIDDLERGIAEIVSTLDLVPDGHPDKAMLLSSYGTALAERHRFTGDPADLGEAIGRYQQAIDQTGNGGIDRARYLANLGTSFASLFEQTDDASQLDRTVDALTEAADLFPLHHPDRTMCLSHLGDALLTRYGLTGSPADLDQAAAVSREAVEHPAPDYLSQAISLTTLSNVLQNQFKRTGDPVELTHAIEAAESALAALPRDYPGRATCLVNLALAMAVRPQETGNTIDHGRAIQLSREAATMLTAPFPIRMEAARVGAALAAKTGDWSAATDAFTKVIELFPMVALRRPARTSQEQLFSDWPGLPSFAAAGAINAGRLDDAVLLLDQGRGVLWAQMLDQRAELSLLEQRDPALARRLRQVRAQLDAPPAGTAWAHQRLSVAREWETLVAHINGLPGMGDLFRPPPMAQLRRAAANGPVVVINTCRWRCDALIVPPGDAPISVVPLPTLTQKALLDRMKEYIPALFESENSQGLARRERVITATLEWLWDHIAEPVLTVLGHDRARQEHERWPRITWCPTGALGLLPIHAAGYHRPDDIPAGRTVLDRVVSSYTTTLRASANNEEPRPTASGPLLFVGMPETPGRSELPGVERERDVVRQRLGQACTVLQGPAATRWAVQHALQQHTMVHFSCHAQQDQDQPSAGGVSLQDGILSVAELTDERHRGEFAFFSACETAFGSMTVIDEVVTLAAVMQYAGWRHVIATLWEVSDTIAANVTESVYDSLTDNGVLRHEGAAEALHHAVREVRNRRKAQGRNYPSEWIPFIHVGT
ncbi:CHAT domain-containing protein (plasmid) [Streptomyces canus]|uniref:CHAT domain-containing protein n=1 Tax=Streptomyces canus TaxID=58343 RepID=UPI002E2C132D|nr:CHAT domain-containing protein [Streptomyces canus]